MTAPLIDIVLTSQFGNRVHPVTKEIKFHNGIDLKAAVGTTVFSPFSGIVDKILDNDTGGKQLIIQHDNGVRTGYAHLNGRLVNVGDRVAEGQPIAETGATGAVTGAHLHFNVKNADGQFIDPLPHVQQAKKPAFNLLPNFDQNYATRKTSYFWPVVAVGLLVGGSYLYWRHDKK